jgi:hypothetical protein
MPSSIRRKLLVLGVAVACSGCGGPVGDLHRAFPAARDILLAAPAPDGSIKTPYSFTREYKDLRYQVDVWLPAILVALVEPVTDAAGLRAWVESERAYLRDQIETNGLVRYHGRKSDIVPDTDDTSLVWLAAPLPDEALARKAIEAIRQFRTPEGLYRTWMNDGGIPGHPNEGLDPNPPDFGINMHIFLFMSRYAPDAAGEVCAVLQAHRLERRCYPYGRLAIPFYYVREVSMRAAGCDLATAEEVFDTSTPGQAVYAEAGRMIRDLALGPKPCRADVARVLRQLAADNFRHAREAPPLIYHADLTALRPRYYWSAEFAAALWMRLYTDAAQHYFFWPDPPS